MPGRACLFAIFTALALLLTGCTQHQPPAHRAPAHAKYTDKRLYRDITAQVVGGASYYTAAVRLQRAHGYPVTPGFTVRLPTLALVAAVLGWTWLRVIAFALLGAGMVAWFRALRGKVTLAERLPPRRPGG